VRGQHALLHSAAAAAVATGTDSRLMLPPARCCFASLPQLQQHAQTRGSEARHIHLQHAGAGDPHTER
jgi:hypothetical protein